MPFHSVVPLFLAMFAGGPPGIPMELTRLTGPIEVDGLLDDPAWASIPLLPLTQYAPVFGAMREQRTEIRLAYDNEYLYAAGAFYDENPQGIRMNSLYRDRWNRDDAFAIYIDPFNDNRNAKWFGTTPATLPDAMGRPYEVPNAVSIYERDGGMLWRHAGESRRARDLVIGFVSAIDNYDYQADPPLPAPRPRSRRRRAAHPAPRHPHHAPSHQPRRRA